MNFSFSIKNPLLLAFFLIFCSVSTANTAQAHRLNVFAWLENDRIIVECNFGTDQPAKNASVSIVDNATDKELLRGKTNDSGIFAFKVPQVVRHGHDLLIQVNAGAGHRNEWTMDASELYAAAALTAGFDEAALEAKKEGITEKEAQPSPPTASEIPAQEPVQPEAPVAAPAPNIPMPQATQALSPEHVRTIIHEAVEDKLGPIRHELAAKNASGPSIAEIIGGLGWIIGLVGIWLWARSRRKQN